jgi:hypothetical protein
MILCFQYFDNPRLRVVGRAGTQSDGSNNPDSGDRLGL